MNTYLFGVPATAMAFTILLGGPQSTYIIKIIIDQVR